MHGAGLIAMLDAASMQHQPSLLRAYGAGRLRLRQDRAAKNEDQQRR
jgi:hypothetical protein